MFKFDTAQKVFDLAGIKIGGQPGENPPLMITSMFHNKDKIVQDRKGNFDRERAKEIIKKQEEMTELTGVPGMVAMVANTPDEAKIYIDFYLETTSMPFGIDMWVAEQRAKATEYVSKLGVQDKFLYNSITPWDKDIKGQVQKLKDLGIKHVVIQAFDDQDQSPAGRVKSLEAILEQGADAFDTVIVDTSVMNMPSTSFSLVANRMIKEKHGLPCGGAYSNGTHMWKEIKDKWGLDGFKAMDAVVQGMSSSLWSDFNFSGPAVTAPRVFPAVASAHMLLSTLVYDETGVIYDNPNLPLRKYYSEFIQKLQEGGSRKKGK
ncbi:MAG: tetrahydromethanopterin S-methyltransferase subunit H [Alphaproteobacteria bacterium]|uniref:Tetrahydromethanopterin S-methyltransferase subunit H n=1 Tax=Candidatus Nitrobium versatile TaxID=2884831 RepID=A0A953J5Y4_9BACT|nr:tetrahydromethanopterin S-methyltransferase subunit H [Candidatus Nitrobium versatile]